MLVAPFRCPLGIIKTGKDHRIVAFHEKPTINSMQVNAGIYVFERRILNYLPEKGRIEETTFPILAQRRLLRGCRLSGQWLTVNTKKDLKIAEHELSKW
jgi:NDP-sugar pyrophosphorylase family protein